MMSDDDLTKIDTKNELLVAFPTDHTYTRTSGLPWHPVVVPMDVFLRIHGADAENKTEQVFHTVDNDNTLVIHSPPNPTEACNVGSQAFRYSKIFPVGACPKAMCDTVFQGVLNTVANGDNFLVFNYGTTTQENAVTMQGSETHTGIVPSVVEALFKRIQGKVSHEIKIKPQGGNCIPVGPRDAVVEHELRNKVLTRSAKAEDQADVTAVSPVPVASKETSPDVSQTEPTEGDPDDLHYSIWASCLEVHNELIYDLLDCEAPRRRVALRLCDRANQKVYVKGAREVCVFTAVEAIDLFATAQENLRRATSHLRVGSSLSHCIFTLRIVSSKDGMWFRASKMNQLTFCNLASFERTPDAQPSGRGSSISASIIALGKCLEAIRSGDAAVPYKESKLTRLLHNYFTGSGRALMMVNINLRADMFDATVHVLKFSALISKVLLSWPLDFLAIPFRPTRCSIELLRQILTGHESESWISPNLEYTCSDTHDDPMQSGSLVILDDEEDDDIAAGHDSCTAKINELVELIQLLQQNLILEKMEKMQLETDCRKELCSHFAAQMQAMEDYYMDRIDAELDDALAYPDKRPPSNKRLKPSQDLSVTSSNGPKTAEEKDSCIAELEALVSNLNSSLETALDSESEAQQKILSLNGQIQQLENRIAELEAEAIKLCGVGGTNIITESQAQELIAALQLRICKQQRQNNMNETLLNQQLNEVTEKLCTAQANLKAKDLTISQLEDQNRDLQVSALDEVRTSNASVKDEIDQFQQLMDSIQAKLKQNEAVVNVLSKRCTASPSKGKENTSAKITELKKSLRDATEKIYKLEHDNAKLLDTLEVFQKMLLKATSSDPKPQRPRRKCAAPTKVYCTTTKRECHARTDSDSSWGGSGVSSWVDEDDVMLDRCRPPPRRREDGDRTLQETEERIRNLETELASLKTALRQTLEKDGHNQRLPAILEALELSRALPEELTASPISGYSLRQRP